MNSILCFIGFKVIHRMAEIARAFSSQLRYVQRSRVAEDLPCIRMDGIVRFEIITREIANFLALEFKFWHKTVILKQ